MSGFEPIALDLLFGFILVFCRFGSAFMLVTGIGEIYVTPRIRLLLALSTSLAIAPVLLPTLPSPPAQALAMFVLVAGEIVVGLLIGGLIRMLQGILHIAGMIIAFQSSLASALLFDANQGSQGSVIGNFMTLIGVTMVFATGLHHDILLGLAHSYKLFPAGTFPPVADFAEMAEHVLSDGFEVAVGISAPLLIMGLLVYLANGLLGRLMPSMQVFYVIVPAQIYVSFVIFVATLSAAMLWYLEHYRSVLEMFFAGK